MAIAARPVLRALAQASVALIEAHQHPSGAYPACPTYPVYRFSWLRDGAFIADAMSRAGRPDSADAFFGWCARVVGDRSERIADLVARTAGGEHVPDAELLPTRYTLDGDDDADPWWNFQLDGYGTWLWALAAHARRHGRPVDPYLAAVRSTVDYLDAFADRPCFDWWEEHAEHRHVSTLAAISGGLRAAAELLPDLAGRAAALRRADAVDADIRTAGIHNGHLTKWLGGGAVDGSLLAGLTAFPTVTPGSPLAEETYGEIDRQLRVGGVYRYRGDTFYGGGEWLILTAWLGWYEQLTGRPELALRRLQWIADQAVDDLLPEQVSSSAQDPSFIEEWTHRWGPVATPLLWSHAMYVTLAVECGVWSPPW